MIEIARFHIDAQRDALALMPPAQRAAYLAALNAHDPQRVIVNRMTPPHATPAPFAAPRHRAAARFMRELQARLQARHYLIGWQAQPEQRLWIGTPLGDAVYWYGIEADAFLPRVTPLYLAFLIGSGVLALLGAWLIQRRINRPLAELARAAAEIGRGRHRMLPLAGLPQEIAQVAASFNQMSNTLEAAERERALMLAGVSHDLRTPLAKLRLAVEIIGAGVEPELVESMVRNIGSADAVIGQFIDFARLGGDEALRVCDVNELVADVAATAAHQPLAVRLTELPPLPCRPLALRRAVGNLVENAIHYGGKDGAPARIAVATACDGTAICITVTDDGPGMPPDQMERLRQPFARLEEARNGRLGAGLGLAIVERIARLHGGALLLRNRSEGGLEAVLRLPVPQEPDGGAAPSG